jgi:hypothetical protein
MPENCVFGRWGSEIHQELNLQTRTKDHHVIVGLQPLIGEPSPFASFVSESSKEDKQRLHMRHGTVKSKRIVRGTRIASFHENLSSLGSNTSNKRGSHIPLGCQNNQLKSNDLNRCWSTLVRHAFLFVVLDQTGALSRRVWKPN